MVMAMENTPHGLLASRLHHHQRQHRDQDHHDDEDADQGGGRRRGAEFVAGHLAQRTAPSPGGDPQHQVVLHAAGEHGADDDPDAAGQIAHLGGQHRTDEWPRPGDGGEMVAEQHPPVGRHVVGAVVEDFGRGGVVVARAHDLHLDQPGIEPESDDVGADRGDHEPHRVHGLAAGERDDRPGDGADHGDDAEDDFVPNGDGGAVDDRDGRQVVIGADVADVFVVHSHGQTLRRPAARLPG